MKPTKSKIDDLKCKALGGGVIQGTASEAVLVALLAARDRTLRKHGKTSREKLVVYASDQTHSALQKACQIAGIFPENFRIVKADCNRNFAVAPEAVSDTIFTDLSAGLVPFFICATVGTTSSSAVDPLPELGQIAKAHDMWFHIDAAYAGSACICPEYRYHLNGVEEADSFNMNAHKWFLTNFDCSLLWVKDRSFLIQSLSTNPEYLKNKASQANSVVDFKDWQIPLGRRFSYKSVERTFYTSKWTYLRDYRGMHFLYTCEVEEPKVKLLLSEAFPFNNLPIQERFLIISF